MTDKNNIAEKETEKRLQNEIVEGKEIERKLKRNTERQKKD